MTAKERPASSVVTLAEEVSRASELPKDEGYYENRSTFFWGEADGHDIMLLEGFFTFGKGDNGPYRIIEGDEATILYSTVMVVPQDDEGGMVNNVFYGNWIDSRDALPNFEIIEESDRLIWKGGNRKVIVRPPYWEITGEAMGVEYDVTLGGLGPVHRPYESWDNFAETHTGGFWVPCWAEGDITYKGKKFTLESGYGTHTYMIHGHNWDTYEMVSQAPYYWIWGMNDSLQFFTFSSAADPGLYSDGFVWNDGTQIRFAPSQVAIDELEFWDDPQSGLRWPCRWHINMNSEEGLLDVNVRGRCRGIFCSLTRKGAEIHYGIFARANGRFFYPDGRSIPIENMMLYVERGRNLMPFDKAI